MCDPLKVLNQKVELGTSFRHNLEFVSVAFQCLL